MGSMDGHKQGLIESPGTWKARPLKPLGGLAEEPGELRHAFLAADEHSSSAQAQHKLNTNSTQAQRLPVGPECNAALTLT